ncbi:MAG TPA: histidinol dehydrogenase [Candidatus Binataceae bacterium]|nr:histidinol dehydrogenase [Candidatus Binataceae bacterium]
MSLPIFSSHTPAFKQWLKDLLEHRSTMGDGVEGAVASIIEAVRERGDQALIEFTERYDHATLTKSALRVSPKEISRALATLASDERKALETAARRIREFHRRTVNRSFTYKDQFGMRLGQLVQPLGRVGIYVPGGAAAYPSTVLMNAIPARVAGVNEIVMMCPATDDVHPQVVLAAAAIAEVDEIYRVGGAQAIAALAYGTETIRAVDKIVGPGNAYVQSAKRMVYGVVDIDKTAGPSEVLIIADDSAKPAWVAADLIAQAEHGSGGESAIVLTTSRAVAMDVSQALEDALVDLPRAEAVRAVLERRGAVVLVKSLAQACEIANQIAPEHLEIDVRRPDQLLKSVRAAGAVFLGSLSPAPLGDYLAGPNHILPTGGTARFASPLGAYDFVKRTSIIQATPAAMATLGPVVAQLARMEGFEGHARAIERRLNRPVTKRRIRRNGR